jgi:hypothetical protein
MKAMDYTDRRLDGGDKELDCNVLPATIGDCVNVQTNYIITHENIAEL